MEYMNMPRLLSFVFTVCAMLLSDRASAQAGRNGAGEPSRAPVLLAIVDTLPDYRIIRLAGASPREAVLLPSDATPELLSEALETLRVVWARDDGLHPAATVMLRRGTRTGDSHPQRVLPWAERVLQDLQAAHRRHVPGLGHVSAVQIWLAPLPAAAARLRQDR